MSKFKVTPDTMFRVLEQDGGGGMGESFVSRQELEAMRSEYAARITEINNALLMDSMAQAGLDAKPMDNKKSCFKPSLDIQVTPDWPNPYDNIKINRIHPKVPDIFKIHPDDLAKSEQNQTPEDFEGMVGKALNGLFFKDNCPASNELIKNGVFFKDKND